MPDDDNDEGLQPHHWVEYNKDRPSFDDGDDPTDEERAAIHERIRQQTD